MNRHRFRRCNTQPRQETRVMAENKDDPGSATKFTQSRKATQTQGAAVDAATHSNAAAQDRGSMSESTAQESPAAVVRRKQRYLIGFRALPGLAPPQLDPFLDRLSHMEGVEIIR